MYLMNFQSLKEKITSSLVLLLVISIFTRIPVVLFLGDNNLENEWRIIVNNLVEYNKFSFRRFDDFFLPNLFMPPLYPFYLYFFTLFNFQIANYILVVLFSQVLLASISVIIFYKINKFFFSEKISFYSSILFSLFPLHLYACSQISSITLQIFLTIQFLFFLFSFVKKQSLLLICLISFSGACLILLRGEFVLVLILTFFYLFFIFHISLKKISLIFLITLLTISPYLARNIIVFEKITITKSFGYNLWKGNNENSNVSGSELIKGSLKENIDNITKDKFYQINRDSIFLKQAIKNIINDPKHYLYLFIKKFLSYLFIDINSLEKNYYHPAHYLPVILIGITSLLGMILSNKKSTYFNYLILIFFLNIFVFSSFFILARYKLIILPLQIIFTNVLFDRLKKKLD